MRWKQFALWILAVACRDGPSSPPPKGRPTSPMFQQWIAEPHKVLARRRTGCRQSNNGGWMFGMPKQVLMDGPVREQVNFNGNGITGSLAYTYQRSGARSRPAERSASGVCP